MAGDKFWKFVAEKVTHAHLLLCLIFRTEEDEGFPAVAVERLLLERIWEQEPTPPGESILCHFCCCL